MLFFERQLLLQVLHERIRHKERIYLNQRVKEIRLSSTSMEVVTTSGDCHRGDLVVGADGIYSRVRQQMTELSEKISPGLFIHH